jgi:F0F1-type ATP synthase membrane subunit a
MSENNMLVFSLLVVELFGFVFIVNLIQVKLIFKEDFFPTPTPPMQKQEVYFPEH